MQKISAKIWYKSMSLRFPSPTLRINLFEIWIGNVENSQMSHHYKKTRWGIYQLVQCWYIAYLGANMDRQFVGNVFGAVAYVASYISKRESDELFTAVHSVINQLPENVSTRQNLQKLANTFLTDRHLSAQEAAYRMSVYHLSHALLQFHILMPGQWMIRLIYYCPALNWRMPVTMTQIFVTSVFDKYAANRLLIYFRKRLSFTPQNIM